MNNIIGLERIYKILNVNKNIFKVQMIDSIIYDQEFKKLMKGE